MATHVFLILCGLSVVFLVYVLDQFWREGHRGESGAEPAMILSRPWNPNLIVVTHPISLSAHGGISVIPLAAQTTIPEAKTEPASKRALVLQMPERMRTGSGRVGARNSKIKAR